MRDSAGEDYTQRLVDRTGTRWKQLLNVQAPYRWNLRRMEPGFTLDVGCGLGRNLGHLNGNGVGVDTNPTSVQVARARGFTAFTPEEFAASEYAEPERFDSVLMAHVVEHLPPGLATQLLRDNLRYVRPGGSIILICPQEAGYASDPTHVQWTDGAALVRLVEQQGARRERDMSFPLPRLFGRVFRYNEFVVTGRLP